MIGPTIQPDRSRATAATMRRTSISAVGFGLVLALLGAAPGVAKHPAVARAQSAIAAGTVDPARDIAPLLEALRRATTVAEKRELVAAIDRLGEADSASPNAVKQYLIANAPPLLLEVIRSGNHAFLQGDAVHALRGMGVPRAVLEQAAALAEADPDSYVQSRGEILRNYIQGLPVESGPTTRAEVDPERARAGIAYLDKRGLSVSTDALRDAARRADADAVRALLDAGVAPDAGVAELNETPIYQAVGVGCHTQGAETDWLVETVRLLATAGADLARTDGNRNTVMISAAQYCGPRVIGALVEAGAKVEVRNGTGITPLALALIVGNFDAAEALVEMGARLGKEDLTMVSGVTDPRGKKLIQRAARR